MESAICLRYCPFPYGSKGFQGARPSRFHHLKINHATPLSLSQISTTISPVTRSFGHVNCMIERFISVPSENEGSGNRILRGVAAASLVLTCVLGLFSFSGKNMNPKLTTAYASPSDEHKNDKFTSAFEAHGRFALKSLLEIPSDEDLADTRNNMPSNFCNRGPSDADFKNLKWLAIGISISPDGRREAQKTLEDHQDNEMAELAMVELWMFKGEFQKARDRLDKIIRKTSKQQPRGIFNKTVKQDNQPSGISKCYETADTLYKKKRLARLILYKAILHTVLGMEEKERKQWWNAFMETCRK